jgi:glutamate-5-semialdehyde dehydrogenase
VNDVVARAADLAGRAKVAAARMARASTAAKDAALLRVAAALDGAETARVVAANAEDLARATDLAAPMIDRLRLDAPRVRDLAAAVRAIAALPDPVGKVGDLDTRPSGIRVRRMQVPLGVILIVYEARPNVTVDAAALCLKAGNAVILRGGKEARATNAALAAVVRDALRAEGLPEDGALLVDDPDRELLYALLGRAGEIDLAIPRGGTSLIDAVNAHARVPVVQHYQGICHVYVHERADLDVAERIVVNAKVQRPGVCNAMEGVVVDAAVAARAVPRLVAALRARGVEVRGDDAVRALAPAAVPATAADWDTEFLALACTMKVVDGYDDAIAFIERHGSRHTESIVTTDAAVGDRFLRDVDASCVLVNASTRFNDGGELGLGAELGISTTKLHAYGPMGLVELTTRKFVVLGDGQTRGSPP